MAPSIWQLVIVLVIILLLFGTKKLRNLGGDLGSAFKGFKKAMNDDEKKAEQDSPKATLTDEQQQARTFEGEAEKVNEESKK